MPPASTSNAVIRVEDAHKYYELGETRVHALRGVSLEIQRGEFVAIMGASGSGKSTFMNMLGCLDRITSGRYFLEGIDVSSHDKKALALIRNQKIGFVFQGFNLLSRTTALENTELPTLYTKVDKAERRQRAADALAMVGLAEPGPTFPFPDVGRTAAACGRGASASESPVYPASRRTHWQSRQPYFSGNHGDLSEPE